MNENLKEQLNGIRFVIDEVKLLSSHITCFIIMLVEYQNKIYRRKERLGLSFCGKCPFRYFNQDPCFVGRIPYTCPVTGEVTLSTSEIFNL